MYLPGVGPNRKKLLSAELGLETYGDLLEYYPYKYVDRSKVYTVRELTGDMPFVQDFRDGATKRACRGPFL